MLRSSTTIPGVFKGKARQITAEKLLEFQTTLLPRNPQANGATKRLINKTLHKNVIIMVLRLPPWLPPASRFPQPGRVGGGPVDRAFARDRTVLF